MWYNREMIKFVFYINHCTSRCVTVTFYHAQHTTNTSGSGSDTLPVRSALLPVLGFPAEDLVGFRLLVLLQLLHVPLLISVCFIKIALREKCGIIFKKQILFR